MFPLGWSCISAGVSGQNVFLYLSVPDFNVKPAAEGPLKPLYLKIMCGIKSKSFKLICLSLRRLHIFTIFYTDVI